MENNNKGIATSLWNIGRRVVDAVNPFASASTRLTATMEDDDESQLGTEYDIDSDVHSVLSGTAPSGSAGDTTYGSDLDADDHWRFVDEIESPSSSAAATRGTSSASPRPACCTSDSILTFGSSSVPYVGTPNRGVESSSAFNIQTTSTSTSTSTTLTTTTPSTRASPVPSTHTNLNSIPSNSNSNSRVDVDVSTTITPISNTTYTYIPSGTLPPPPPRTSHSSESSSPSQTHIPPAPRPSYRHLPRSSSPSASASPDSDSEQGGCYRYLPFRYSPSSPSTSPSPRRVRRADTPYPYPSHRRGSSHSSGGSESASSSEEESLDGHAGSDLERTRLRARRERNEGERQRASELGLGLEMGLTSDGGRGGRLATYAESARAYGVPRGERFAVVGRFGVGCAEEEEDGDGEDDGMEVDELEEPEPEPQCEEGQAEEEEAEAEGEVKVKQESLSPALSMRGFSSTWYDGEPHVDVVDHERLRMQADLFLNDLLGDGGVGNVKAELDEDQTEELGERETRLSPIPDLSSALAGLPPTTTTVAASVGLAVPYQLVGFVGSSVPAQPVAGPSHRNTQAEEQPVAGPSHSQDEPPPRAIDEDWWRSGPCPYPRGVVRRPVYPEPFLAPLVGTREGGGESELPESIRRHILTNPTNPTAHHPGDSVQRKSGSAGDLRAVAYDRRVRVPSMEGEVPWIGDGVEMTRSISSAGPGPRRMREERRRERREGRASPYASPSPSPSPPARSRSRSRAPSPTARSDRIPTADAPVPVPEAGAESSASTSAVETTTAPEGETPSALRRSQRISAMVKREREREEREAKKERAKTARKAKKAKKDKEVKKDAKATKGKGKGRA